MLSVSLDFYLFFIFLPCLCFCLLWSGSFLFSPPPPAPVHPGNSSHREIKNSAAVLSAVNARLHAQNTAVAAIQAKHINHQTSRPGCSKLTQTNYFVCFCKSLLRECDGVVVVVFFLPAAVWKKKKRSGLDCCG